jgi:hypothetical protein
MSKPTRVNAMSEGKRRDRKAAKRKVARSKARKVAKR